MLLKKASLTNWCEFCVRYGVIGSKIRYTLGMADGI